MPSFIFVIIAGYVVTMLLRAAKVSQKRPGVARPPRPQPNAAQSVGTPQDTRNTRQTVFDRSPELETVRKAEKQGAVASAVSNAGIHTYRRAALNAKSMRRAMIVSEIISKPVSMRGE